MKKLNLLLLAIPVSVFALSLSSCQEEDFGVLGSKDLKHELNVSKPDAASFEFSEIQTFAEKSTEDLTKDWWKYVMSFNCDNNPLFGIPALAPAEGPTATPVVYLVGAMTGAETQNVQISKNQLLVVPVINVINDYPCRGGANRPEPDKYYEQYLKASAGKFIDQAVNLSATLDGKSIRINYDNRISTDLFYLTPHKDLVNCLDYCIRGDAQPQAAVSDGYWLIMRSLTRGNHKLIVHAEVPEHNMLMHTTYNIIVR